MIIGTTVVALDAIVGDCVHPMKKSEMMIVLGSPAITPPSFEPSFSAMIVENVIQIPPSKKLRRILNRKLISIYYIVCATTSHKACSKTSLNI